MVECGPTRFCIESQSIALLRVDSILVLPSHGCVFQNARASKPRFPHTAASHVTIPTLPAMSQPPSVIRREYSTIEFHPANNSWQARSVSKTNCGFQHCFRPTIKDMGAPRANHLPTPEHPANFIFTLLLISAVNTLVLSRPRVCNVCQPTIRTCNW